MLDQNTDRTWWMIGAVIVGAVMVGLARYLFPEVFESVVEVFKDGVDDVDFSERPPSND